MWVQMYSQQFYLTSNMKLKKIKMWLKNHIKFITPQNIFLKLFATSLIKYLFTF